MDQGPDTKLEMQVIAPPPKGAQREHQRRRGVPVVNMPVVFLAGWSAGAGLRG